MSEPPVIDIRGEPCGMPIVRVEKFLLERSGGADFAVLSDHEQTVDQLRLLAARHGWTCAVARERGGWRLLFHRG